MEQVIGRSNSSLDGRTLPSCNRLFQEFDTYKTNPSQSSTRCHNANFECDDYNRFSHSVEDVSTKRCKHLFEGRGDFNKFNPSSCKYLYEERGDCKRSNPSSCEHVFEGRGDFNRSNPSMEGMSTINCEHLFEGRNDCDRSNPSMESMSAKNCEHLFEGLEGYQMITVFGDGFEQIPPQYETLLAQFLMDEPPKYSEFNSKLHERASFQASTTTTSTTSMERRQQNFMKRYYTRYLQMNSCKIYMLKVFIGAMFVLTFIVIMAVIKK